VAGLLRDDLNRPGVQWGERKYLFDTSEEHHYKIVAAMWPPEQGKRKPAHEVKAAVGSKAKGKKWAVNAASDASKILGRLRFPFKLTGISAGGGFFQWEEESDGTR